MHVRYEKSLQRYQVVVILILLIGYSIQSQAFSNGSLMHSDQSDSKTYFVGGDGPFNFSKIQYAIDNASDGDTIYVYKGIYFEHLVVDKSIYLHGENKSNTIIHGSNSGDVPCIKIIKDNVIVEGFNIIWADWEYHEPGIKIYSDNVLIKNNNISTHDKGIIVLPSSQNSTITNNVFYNNHESIWLWPPGSHYHLIKNNVFTFGDYGIISKSSNNNIIKNNTISTQSWAALLFEDSKNNTIIENTISNNSRGISIKGISFDNVVYHNNFIENIHHVAGSGDTIWDNGYPDGGNYWDDYTGEDLDGDGIGDQPYQVSGGKNYDHYPCMRIDQWKEKSLQVSCEGPKEEFVNNFLQFNSIVKGGLPPYQWKWDFDDDCQEFIQYPIHQFQQPGKYNVSCIVTDSLNNTASDTMSINIYDLDNIPPDITVLSPLHGIYRNNDLIYGFTNIPISIIFGPITIAVSVIDYESTVSYVNLTIENTVSETFNNGDVSYFLSDSIKGFIKIEIKAKDFGGNIAQKKIDLIKI